MGDNQPQTTPATNLDDKVDVTLVVITGDGSVGADHQAAVNTSDQVDVLACTHRHTKVRSWLAWFLSLSVCVCFCVIKTWSLPPCQFCVIKAWFLCFCVINNWFLPLCRLCFML